ncbi:MAG TPA: CAP domain-containing protein [Acidimicrobiales bacterium]|nr:CAP domain-containing protein [Acidimicrobiales bacterium]
MPTEREAHEGAPDMIARRRISSKLVASTLTFLLVFASIGVLEVAQSAAAFSADEASFFNATNAYRQANGLPPLQYDAAASAVALGWSQSMAASGTLSHNPNLVNAINAYVTPSWTRLGENVGVGPSVSSIQSAFVNSPTHRANILGDFNRVGVGTVHAGSTIWVTLDFVKGPDIGGPVVLGSDGPPSDPMKSPAVTSWPSTGRVDVFQRGQDGALWARALVAGAWGPWYTLGGALTSQPTASSWGAGRIDVFATGLDGSIWHRALAAGTWRPWEDLGGALTSGPGAVSSSTNRIDVFARGRDGGLWGRAMNSTTWSSWYPLGGSLVSAPDVASWGAGRLDVFVIGVDAGVWHRAFSNGAWRQWDSLGGRLTSGVGSVSRAANLIDVMSRGTDGAMWANAWTGSGWSGWYTLGGLLASAPDVGTLGTSQLTTAARGSDGLIWLNSLASSRWSGWYLLG